MSFVAYFLALLVISGYLHILKTPSNYIKLIHYDAAHLNMQASKCGLYCFLESAILVYAIDQYCNAKDFIREFANFYGLCSHGELFFSNENCLVNSHSLNIFMFSIFALLFPFFNSWFLRGYCFVRDRYISNPIELSSDIYKNARENVIELDWLLRERWRYQRSDPIEHLLLSSLILNELLIFTFKDNKVMVGKVLAVTSKEINKEHKLNVSLALTARGKIDEESKLLDLSDFYYSENNSVSSIQSFYVCFKLDEVVEISPYQAIANKPNSCCVKAFGFIDTNKDVD